MKKKIIILLSIMTLTACDNKEEKIKNEYIKMKNNILEETEYTEKSDIPLDIIVDMKNEDEKIKYKVTLKNPKEDMKEIKAMIVHNYYTEDVFPSIGIFDDKKTLTKSSEESIELEDTIETTKDLSQIDLELKIWLEYKNSLNQKKHIFYKTT